MTTYEYKNSSVETVRKFVTNGEGNPESGIFTILRRSVIRHMD